MQAFVLWQKQQLRDMKTGFPLSGETIGMSFETHGLTIKPVELGSRQGLKLWSPYTAGQKLAMGRLLA